MIKIEVNGEDSRNNVEINGKRGDVLNDLCNGLAHAVSLIFDNAHEADLFLRFLSSEEMRDSVEDYREDDDE